jgi:hypothetical protein
VFERKTKDKRRKISSVSFFAYNNLQSKQSTRYTKRKNGRAFD